MTLQECYAQIGNWEDVIGRMCSEKLVQKFILKFLDDPSYDQLCVAMANGDCNAAFMAAHTLKGICANLGLTQLLQSSCALTELLRAGNLSGSGDAYGEVQTDYAAVMETIRQLQSSLS